MAVLAGLAAPTGYALATAATPHTGAIPSAGPSGGMRRSEAVVARAAAGRRLAESAGRAAAQRRAGCLAAAARLAARQAERRPAGLAAGAGRVARRLLGSPTPSAQVVALLQRDAAEYTWAAAAVGSNTAAGYQLATGLPVMAVGGFNGTDPSPTLAQFQELVAAKKIHWFVGRRRMRTRTRSGGSDDAAAIARWVQQHYPATTVGGTTLYDLSGAAS